MTTTINADTSTGGAVISGDASGVLGLQAAGVTKVTINSSGVTLANPLPVASGGTGTTSLSNIATQWTTTGSDIYYSTGNVGIGTSSLSGNGRLELNVPSGNNTNIAFYENGASRWLIGSVTGSNAFRFYDLANAAERFQIASTGALGFAGANYGTSGQVLTSSGSGSAPTWTTPASGFSNMTVFTGSGTWTIPAGITKCKVIVTGGGGGSGNAYAGAAGGTAIKIVTLTGSTATITVGSGGSANTSGYAGTSSFVNGSTTVSATGGGNGATGSGYSPTSGGYGSGGDMNITGGGGDGVGQYATGGSSYWGGGATWSGNGAYGSGGGYYGNVGANAGYQGVVVIEY